MEFFEVHHWKALCHCRRYVRGVSGYKFQTLFKLAEWERFEAQTQFIDFGILLPDSAAVIV